MPAAKPARFCLRALRAAAVAIAVMAVALVCAVAAPQSAYAYSTNPSGAVGKVTGAKYGRTYYGTSVADVMHIVDDMTSSYNNKLHEYEVTIELMDDWNTKSYGRIKVPSGYTYHINLNGHMINRDRALNSGKDKKWYASGSGEVIYVDGGTLYLDGGTGAFAYVSHAGYTDDNGKFWKYDGKGSSVIKGGLITGGACDDWHGAGGISLASSSSRAYIKNVTIAGNITDQVDSSRYGHGAGIAVHGSGCTLELDNVKVDYNHAEGYGGGIYVRETPSRLVFTNSEVCSNTGIKGGGGIYFDCKIDQTIESVKINDNVTHASGGGIYFGDSDSKLTIKGTSEKDRVSISGNTAKKYGGGVYSGGSSAQIEATYANFNSNKAEGGGLYINGNKSKVTLEHCNVSENCPEADGGGFYIDGNECTIVVKDSNMSGNDIWDHNGGAMYHNGKKGSVTFENTVLAGNEAAERSGGLVYNKYDGTTFTFKDLTISGSKAAKGGAFYLEDVTTLILDNATIKECDGDGFGVAGGGAVYTIDNGTKIEMKNNAKIVECSALTEGDGGATAEGGAIYSSGTTTITSPDGTGVISGCVAKIDTDQSSGYGGHGGNGGGIWFKGELCLDNITITGNSAETDPNNYSNGFGGGVYCANESYKAFEVARTVKITGNTAERLDEGTMTVHTLDSNLYLCGSSGQEVCSASGDRALTADSRIGVEAGMGSATRRRVTGNQAMLANIKDCYGTVFTSDNTSYSIALDGNYVYLSSDLPSYSVSVKTGCYSKSWSAKFGSEIRLYTDEWLTYKDDDDYSHEMNEYRYGSEYNKIDYWTVTDSYGTRTVVPETKGERQVATFTLRGSDATAVPHVIRPVGAVGLKIVDGAGWDELAEGSASVSLTYTNVRDVAYSVPDSDVWEPDDWEKIYMLVKDAGTDKLDSITTDAATLVSGTEVKRAKVEDVTTKAGAVTGKKVTYEVTLKKSLLGDDLYSRTKQLVAFQAQVNNSELGDQVVEDQTDSYRSVTYRSKLCSVTTNDAGDMTVSFSVTYPAVRTVTFDTGDGAFADGSKAVSLHTRSGGTLASLPGEVPTREGYAFDGWYLANEQGEPSDTAVTTATVFGSDAKVVAKWRATTKYRMVLYMSQEGESSEAPSIVDVDLAVFEGETATVEIEKPATDPVREGYTFGGWYTDAACTAGNEFFNNAGVGTVTYVDDDLCLYAKWTPETYSVTFDADDGTPVPGTQSVAYGTKATVPATAPTKTGYTFLYWAVDGVSEAYDFDIPVTANLALKAVWEKSSYTVEYKSGDETVAKTKVVDGECAPSMDPGENPSHRFDGWYKDPACTEGSEYDFDTPVTADLTLYAKWVRTCTVTFTTPEDAEQVDVLTVDAGTELSSADLPRPTRENYRFHGWLVNGKAIDPEFTVDSDMELEAHWVGRTIFVYLLDNDDADCKMMNYGDTLTEESLEVKEGKQYPTREGFTFKGWYTDEERTDPVEYGTTLIDDLDLYAKWEAETRTVTFNTQGGSEVASQTLSYADCASEPEAPTRAGYVFKGWFTNEKCTEPWDFDDPVTEDMTLYAKWADTVTITLDANGGVQTDPSSITIERGTAVGVLPVPRRESSDPYDTPSADDGYVFAGWYTEDGKKVDAETEFSESTTLTAYWERNGEACFVSYYSCGEMLNYDVVKTGEKVAKPADPTRTGYEFTGWYVDEACTEAYDFGSAVTGDLKLYAGWKETSGGGDSDDGTDGGSGKGDKGRKDALPGTGDDSAVAVVAALVAGCGLVGTGVATKRRRG